ncbi:putative aspartic proteinase GIP2 [Rosa sericea]
MASSSFRHLLFCSLAIIFHMIFVIIPSEAKTPFRPKALVLPVSKHTSGAIQYLTSIKQRTPLVPVRLTLDLGGTFLWVDCEDRYVSSTYEPAHCGSAQCSLARSKRCFECLSPPRPGCYNNTCNLMSLNSVLGSGGNFDQVGQDVISLHSTDGSNPTKIVSIPNLLFGIAGLGRTKIGLPSQFASTFSFKRKFAVCLPSSRRSYGVVFFGDGPYNLLPGIDVSKSLIYTPLIVNPVTTGANYEEGEPSSEYFINVTSIKINGKVVSGFSTSLLIIDKEGYGGTKISSVNPYTVMETSIYNAFVDLFTKELSGVPRVTPVEPFGVCFNSTNLGSTRVGPPVPTIDLVLQSESVYWRIFGANSMVQVSQDVLCLEQLQQLSHILIFLYFREKFGCFAPTDSL